MHIQKSGVCVRTYQFVRHVVIGNQYFYIIPQVLRLLLHHVDLDDGFWGGLVYFRTLESIVNSTEIWDLSSHVFSTELSRSLQFNHTFIYNSKRLFIRAHLQSIVHWINPNPSYNLEPAQGNITDGHDSEIGTVILITTSACSSINHQQGVPRNTR